MCTILSYACNTFPIWDLSGNRGSSSNSRSKRKNKSCSRFQVPPHTVHVITQYETEIAVFFGVPCALTHTLSLTLQIKNRTLRLFFLLIIIFIIFIQKDKNVCFLVLFLCFVFSTIVFVSVAILI